MRAILCLLATLIPVCAIAQQVTGAKADSAGRQTSDPWADFDECAATALADLQTPGMAIAVVQDGQVVLARGYGFRRVGEQAAVDKQTIFPIGSVSKVFTATCLAQLPDERRLAWDDPVVKHLHEFRLHDAYA